PHGGGDRRQAAVVAALLPGARRGHRQRGDAVRRHRPRRRLRRDARAGARDGHGDGTGHLGGRPLGVPSRGGGRRHRRRPRRAVEPELGRLGVNPHLERTLDAMADAGVDVLLLGREANARYVTGADRLSVAGSRAFAPGCVVVRETGAVHMLSITDDGLPSDIPPSHLFPISWNPMNIVGGITKIEGVTDARRIGVDGMTPLFDQLFQGMLPNAEIVDGESLLREVREAKTDEDVDGIRAAVAVVESALGAVRDALAPGVTERELKGIFEEHMATHGARTPSFEGTFSVVDAGKPPRSMPTDRAVRSGDLVQVRVGVLRDGWEGAIARTLGCDVVPPEPPSAHAATIALAVDGATVGDLRATGATVEGVGIGHEEMADVERLEPGIVLYIERWSDPMLCGDTVLVGEDSPEVLTSA